VANARRGGVAGIPKASARWRKTDLYERPGVEDESGDPAVDRVLALMPAEDW
jgi:hypothetical protein